MIGLLAPSVPRALSVVPQVDSDAQYPAFARSPLVLSSRPCRKAPRATADQPT